MFGGRALAFAVARTGSLLPTQAEAELAHVGRRFGPLEAFQPGDAIKEIHYSDGQAVLGRCENVPAGYAAGCEHNAAVQVSSLEDCARALRDVDGADTINYSGEICQIQTCGAAAPTVPYTHLYGSMDVYSYKCARSDLHDYSKDVHADDVGKQADYWTTSIAFKRDLRAFFREKAKNWTVVELGTYRGYTTRVLSELFQRVIAVEASDVFLGHNQQYNADRDNILFLQLHTQMDGLKILRQNRVEVVFVDAEHDYESVSQDIREVLRYLSKNLRYVVFDDYATDEGVRRAVQEAATKGQLRLVGGVGQRPPWSYHGQVVHDWEGVICEATNLVPEAGPDVAVASVTSSAMLNRWYGLFADSLWYSDETIEFRAGGTAATSRGPGTWWQDGDDAHGIWFRWGSHKPIALGGTDSTEPILQTWYLQFDEYYDKFAATLTGESPKFAAGMAQDVLQSMLRRLFVSFNHEFCNTANECEQRNAAVSKLTGTH